MKYPKIILRKDISCSDEWTEYKYHHKEYEGCYCYIHWWQNCEGKWKPFKLYFEKGNLIYEEYQDKQNGIINEYSSHKFIEWED